MLYTINLGCSRSYLVLKCCNSPFFLGGLPLSLTITCWFLVQIVTSYSPECQRTSSSDTTDVVNLIAIAFWQCKTLWDFFPMSRRHQTLSTQCVSKLHCIPTFEGIDGSETSFHASENQWKIRKKVTQPQHWKHLSVMQYCLQQTNKTDPENSKIYCQRTVLMFDLWEDFSFHTIVFYPLHLRGRSQNKRFNTVHPMTKYLWCSDAKLGHRLAV